jgi:23S rRNA-/tRNA-specific pseudouridylate synthase
LRRYILVMKPDTPKKSHQLRVTCKALGAPVLGDALYAGPKAKVWAGATLLI